MVNKFNSFCIVIFIFILPKDERTGALTCFLASARAKQAVESQLKIILRTMISNPPHHGARVVATILKSTKLRQEWLYEKPHCPVFFTAAENITLLLGFRL
jgi:hypothetical protein